MFGNMCSPDAHSGGLLKQPVNSVSALVGQVAGHEVPQASQTGAPIQTGPALFFQEAMLPFGANR